MHCDNHTEDGIEVMYVEDQHVNVLLMRAMFQLRPQLKLQVALDVKSALLLAPGIRPSLLLLDLRLPDGHGTSLLTELRNFPHLQHLPAIAVTAEYQFDAAGSGFVEVWRKPIDLKRMLERLDHWLVPRSVPDAGQTRPLPPGLMPSTARGMGGLAAASR